MIDLLKNKLISKLSSDKKVLFSNFAYMSLLQMTNYLLQLLTIPYLLRTLGTEKYGITVFAISFINNLVTVTDFGFDASANRQVSINRDNKDKVSEIFCSVMIIKFIILIITFLLLLILMKCSIKFSENKEVFIYTFGIVIGNVIFPTWFFLGIEKMKFISIINMIIKSLVAISIFILIKKPDDYILYTIVNSIGYVIAGGIALYLALSEFKLKIYIPKIKNIKFYFIESIEFFVGRLSISFYTTANTFFVGYFIDYKTAAFYNAAEKLYDAVSKLYSPLISTLYPYMSKNKNLKFYKKLFKISILVNTVFSLLVLLLSSFLIYIIFGKGMEISSDILKIFSFINIIVFPAVLLGNPLLSAMGYSKFTNLSIFLASIFHIIGLIIIIPFINVYLITSLLILTHSIVLYIRYYGARKYIFIKNKTKILE